MPKGVVRSFNEENGYGFIDSEDGGTLFVHYKEILMDGFRTLKKGEQVSFEMVAGSRGPEAVQVRKV